MENRLFTYISSSKINMFYNQSNSVISKEINAEVGGEISTKVAKVNGKLGGKEVKSVNLFGKLEHLEKKLNGANLVGGLFDNKQFIQGEVPLSCLDSRKEAVTWLYSYYDNKKHVYYNFLFYGSNYNIIGMEDYPHRSAASNHNHFVHEAILEIAKNESEREKTYYNLLKKWEIVEYLKQQYGRYGYLSEACNSRFLVRIDYRETIPIKSYMASDLIHRFYSKPHMDFNDDIRELAAPNDTEYVVYVFGSPIYIEHVPRKDNIHIIDGKTLLYLSDEKIDSFAYKEGGKLDERKAIEYVKNRLWDAGMVKESKQIVDEYWDTVKNNHYNNIGNGAFIELVRKYTTPIPPL